MPGGGGGSGGNGGGSGGTTQTPPSLAFASPPYVVSRYTPASGGTAATFFDLPNIRWLSTQWREGPGPPVGRFRYDFQDVYNSLFPTRAEQVLGYVSPAVARLQPYVVQPDDRLVVRVFNADGTWTIYFDGFAQVPQADLSAEAELVTFEALGTPIREFDAPLPGAVYRDATNPNSPPLPGTPNESFTTRDLSTDDPTRFNPDGKPNGTVSGADSGPSGGAYPVLVDERITRPTAISRLWTLGMAARYLLGVGNPKTSAPYVSNPDMTLPAFDRILQAITPVPSTGTINMNDNTTFKYEDIIVPDLDVTGLCWPEALHRLISPHGFNFRYVLTTQASDGSPVWTIDIYRTDDQNRVKSVYLDVAGATLNFQNTNLTTVQLQRDTARIVNEWHVQSKPIQYELSVILAPGFPMTAADATANWAKEADSFNSDPSNYPYRFFHAGEAADPVYRNDQNTAVANFVLDLSKVLNNGYDANPNGPTNDPTVRYYARRRRPGLHTLATLDGDGNPLDAQLWVSIDYPTLYSTNYPAVFDPATMGGYSDTRADASKPHWVRVTEGGWKLLPDRLGIFLTTADPKSWGIFDPHKAPSTTAKVVVGGKLNVPLALAGSDASNPPFVFMLTCVIEGDHDLDVISARRQASPTTFKVIRHDDCRDRYRKRIISARSHLNLTGADAIAEDDSTQAQAHADGRRRANEYGRFAGVLSIPWLSTAYQLGDKIDQVRGRGISFNGLANAQQNEQPVIPSVVGIDHQIEPTTATVMHLSDTRGEGTLPSRALEPELRPIAPGRYLTTPQTAPQPRPKTLSAEGGILPTLMA